jgi:hypothetical protein
VHSMVGRTTFGKGVCADRRHLTSKSGPGASMKQVVMQSHSQHTQGFPSATPAAMGSCCPGTGRERSCGHARW